MLRGSEVVQVNLVRTVPKVIQEHGANAVKLVPQVFPDPKVKMVKMDPPENLERTDCPVLREKGVPLDSEDLLDPLVLLEKRVPLGSVVDQALQDPEERLENLAEMVPLELRA